MGDAPEIGYGEQARVTGGEYVGKTAEVQEYFLGPEGGHYFVYVDGMFTAIEAKYLEQI